MDEDSLRNVYYQSVPPHRRTSNSNEECNGQNLVTSGFELKTSPLPHSGSPIVVSLLVILLLLGIGFVNNKLYDWGCLLRGNLGGGRGRVYCAWVTCSDYAPGARGLMMDFVIVNITQNLKIYTASLLLCYCAFRWKHGASTEYP